MEVVQLRVGCIVSGGVLDGCIQIRVRYILMPLRVVVVVGMRMRHSYFECLWCLDLDECSHITFVYYIGGCEYVFIYVAKLCVWVGGVYVSLGRIGQSCHCF